MHLELRLSKALHEIDQLHILQVIEEDIFHDTEDDIGETFESKYDGNIMDITRSETDTANDSLLIQLNEREDRIRQLNETGMKCSCLGVTSWVETVSSLNNFVNTRCSRVNKPLVFSNGFRVPVTEMQAQIESLLSTQIHIQHDGRLSIYGHTCSPVYDEHCDRFIHIDSATEALELQLKEAKDELVSSSTRLHHMNEKLAEVGINPPLILNLMLTARNSFRSPMS
jgi:hypothetical protein